MEIDKRLKCYSDSGKSFLYILNNNLKYFICLQCGKKRINKNGAQIFCNTECQDNYEKCSPNYGGTQ